MTKKEMAIFILECVAKGVSANQIETERKGASISKLKKELDYCEKISDKKMLIMYERARALSDSLTTKEETAQDSLNNTLTDSLTTGRINKLEKENTELKRRIEALEACLNPTLNNSLTNTKSPKILGFNIRLQSKTVKGYKYTTWTAGRNIAGKQVNVYLGASPDHAEQKIKAYLERHQVTL